jgi:hypothetical protein
MKKILVILGLLIYVFLLSIIFMLVGMNVGGNYFTNFELFGTKGYEATGYLGFLIGLVIASSTSIFIYLKISKKLKGD